MKKWSRALAFALVCSMLPVMAWAQASPTAQSAAPVLDAGEYLSCTLYENGVINCWGDSAYAYNRPPLGSYTALSVGFDHGCALRVRWCVGAIPVRSSPRRRSGPTPH